MKITPLDIQQVEFKKRLRGYDPREVREFLEDVAQTVESLAREGAALRERLAQAEQQLAELRKAETTLTQTLVSTQAMAEGLKQAAQRDAEFIIREAELKAAELLRGAREDLAALQRDLTDLRKQRVLAIERLRSTLRTFERLLEVEEGVEEQAEASARPQNM
ncbi:DivIVA domain-containing protein [Nitrospira sp. Kam-Ns4a]